MSIFYRPNRMVYATRNSCRQFRGMIHYSIILKKFQILIDSMFRNSVFLLHWSTLLADMICGHMILCNFQSFETLEATVIISTGTIFGGLWLLTLVVFQRLYIGTKITYVSWKSYYIADENSKRNIVEFRKYMKTVKPFAIHFCTFYLFKPVRVIGFLNSAIWGTLRSTLTIPCSQY